MARRLHSEEPSPLTRRWWFGRIRNALWILLVSVLIWIYADMQHTETQEITAYVVLYTTNPDQTITSPTRIKVVFTLVGSRKNLEAFRDKHSNRDLLKFDLAKAGPGSGGAIPTLKILRQTPDLVKLGLSVQSVSPETIEVRLDEVVEHDVPVEFVPTGRAIAGPPTVTPPRIKIRVPQTVWARILNRTGSKPKLQSVPVDLRGYEPGKSVTIKNVKLQDQIAGEAVALTGTTTVSVTAKIGQHTDVKEFNVSVGILSPATWAEDGTWEKLVLVRKDPLEWRPRIKVTGSKTDIEKAREGLVEAYVILEDRHKKAIESWETEEVQIRFLGGLQLHLVGSPPKVRFKMQPRIEKPTPP